METTTFSQDYEIAVNWQLVDTLSKNNGVQALEMDPSFKRGASIY